MSQKLNSGGRERASQVPDLHFKNLQFRAKISLFFFFLPKTALEPAENGQSGHSGYSTHTARLHRAEGPSRAL